MELSVMNKKEKDHPDVGKCAEKPRECAGPMSSSAELGQQTIPCRLIRMFESRKP